ncbi:glycoside hydrolase superfamily [Collybia nuda]|uniref:glucan 1,3-beta-glucosidase n=1 Tax=Collybia nuda TaxID=64659 RepID=A0A9P6CDK1_9AGAR|nr:glycoside hydrolase superfamily [Collybia nuda]
MADHHTPGVPNIPLPPSPSPLSEDAPFLDPPRASYLESSPATPRDSFAPSTLISNNNSGPLLPPAEKGESNGYSEEQARSPGKTKRRPILIILFGLAILAVVILAIILPVYFTVIKPKQRSEHSGSLGSDTDAPAGTGPIGGGTNDPESPTGATSGGDGSTVITEDGTNFTYSNKFGGFWVSDPNDPFNNNARPNSWTPPLNQSWAWGKDRVFGVNLGGLFVLEPFISPALFQKYPGSVDEWTLSEMMAADTANGGLDQLEEHYKTFITEQDIAEIAGAGLNWIRLPVPYWAVEILPGEPFLAKTSWKYILRVISWCRKYGLRVNLDLHTIPGSQNGYNHSGRLGRPNFLNGVMGIANAQRALEVMRVFTQFISQPQYKDVVPMFGIMNEALLSTIGRSTLTSFYLEAHDMIRNITGYGEGNGPYISIHDGFGGLDSWANFLPGSDRIALDTHPYFAFSGSPATSPIDTGTGNRAGGIWPEQACNRWAAGINGSRSNFGVTISGEFSNGFNDCGLYLKGIPGRSTTYGGDCADWEDSSKWSAATKAGLQRFAMASMDALGDFFFWTWKIGNSTAGIVEAPLWSYQLGLRNGWMPQDPRTAMGVCESLGASGRAFDGKFKSWQTGGAGAGTIAPSLTSQFPWPPPSISNAGAPGSLLPVYTPTGAVVTLAPPTLTPSPSKSVDVGNGWFNAKDTASAPTPIAGCTYPDAWDAIGVAVPRACGGGAAKRAPVATAEAGTITSAVHP